RGGLRAGGVPGPRDGPGGHVHDRRREGEGPPEQPADVPEAGRPRNGEALSGGKTNHRGTEDTEDTEEETQRRNTNMYSLCVSSSVSSVPLWFVFPPLTPESPAPARDPRRR